MGRLELKLLALLLLLTGVPLGTAAWFAGRAFEHTLAVGLNPVVSEALDDAVRVFGAYLAAEKARQRLNAERIAESRALAEKAAAGPDTVRRWLQPILDADPSLVSLRVIPHSGAPIEVARSIEDPTQWLQRTEHVPLRGVPNLERLDYTFRHERAIIDQFRRMETDVIQPFAGVSAKRTEIANDFRWGFVAALGAALSIAALIAIVVGRRLTRRLKNLREGMQAVAAGDLAVDVPPAGHDEIAELSAGFNDMTRQLRESRERVEYLTQVSAWQGIARRLAHEIKNPLTPIQLAMQQTHQSYKGDDARYRKTLDTAREVIEEEVQTLKRLVENFSRFARLPTASLEPADLCRLAQDLVLAHPEIDDLVAETEDTPIMALVDRGLVRQALTNLLKNGAEAARDAQRPAQVRLQVRRVAGGWSEVAVEDNGPGVPIEARGRVFEPYITGKSDGTGLGLAIVKKIVVEHHGTIEVGDARHGGARFVIRLPPLDDEAPKHTG